MANASMVLLDETLNYLNGKEIDNIAVMGAMMEQEAAQFLSFTESTDIVLNEKFSAKELKEKAIKAIKVVIDKINDFIKWVKDKVVGFFKAVRNKLKSRKSLKQLLSEVSYKPSNESVSFVNEDAVSNKAKVDELLKIRVGINPKWSPDRIAKIADVIAENYTDLHEYASFNDLIEDLYEEPDKIIIKDDILELRETSASITIGAFIRRGWEEEHDKLCSKLSNATDHLELCKRELQRLENKLARLNGYSDDAIMKANSISDLLSMSSDENEKQSIQEQIKNDTHYIKIMTEYFDFAHKYSRVCQDTLSYSKRFLENLKKEINDSKKVIKYAY